MLIAFDAVFHQGRCEVESTDEKRKKERQARHRNAYILINNSFGLIESTAIGLWKWLREGELGET